MRCSSNGASGAVVWYPGTDDESIYASLCAACKVDTSENVEFVEDKASAMMDIFGSPQKVCAPHAPMMPLRFTCCAPGSTLSGRRIM